MLKYYRKKQQHSTFKLFEILYVMSRVGFNVLASAEDRDNCKQNGKKQGFPMCYCPKQAVCNLVTKIYLIHMRLMQKR